MTETKIVDQIDYVYRHPEVYEGREKLYVEELIATATQQAVEEERKKRIKQLAFVKDQVESYRCGRHKLLLIYLKNEIAALSQKGSE